MRAMAKTTQRSGGFYFWGKNDDLIRLKNLPSEYRFDTGLLDLTCTNTGITCKNSRAAKLVNVNPVFAYPR